MLQFLAVFFAAIMFEGVFLAVSVRMTSAWTVSATIQPCVQEIVAFPCNQISTSIPHRCAPMNISARL